MHECHIQPTAYKLAVMRLGTSQVRVVGGAGIQAGGRWETGNTGLQLPIFSKVSAVSTWSCSGSISSAILDSIYCSQ